MRLLIVGCGSIGRRHAANGVGLADTAVVDSDMRAAGECARRLGTSCFPELASALAWKPDRVVVAVPNHLHLSVAREALNVGADVLIEKPIAESLESARRFINQAPEAASRVFVACNMRFHPGVSALRSALGRIGRPLFARAHVGNYLPSMRPGRDYRELYCARRKTGGGVILDAIHEIDYLMWFFGAVSGVTSVAAKLSDLDIDVEDYACICLRHGGGVVSEIQMDYLRPFKRRGCEIVGEKGMLLWASEGKSPERCHVRGFSSDEGRWDSLLVEEDVDTNRPYRKMLECFLNGGTARGMLLDGPAALDELKVALQAQNGAGLSDAAAE